MTVQIAAETVLSEAGQPQDYKEITRQMVARGLWKTVGATPQATVNSVLAMDIKRRGADSAFQRVAPGVYALRKWGQPAHTSPTRSRKVTPVTDPKSSLSVPASLSFSDVAEAERQ
jgi:hypothetical protein